jgi:hypothetical protein
MRSGLVRHRIGWSAGCLLLAPWTALWAAGELTAVDEAPAEVPAKVTVALALPGQAFATDEGPVGRIWLVKELATQADFKSSLNVKYPLSPGHLVGVLQIDKEGYVDFRGQDVAPGIYTLRYGRQPVDGNHVGTSELHDFLLAIPAAADDDPAPLKSLESLMMKSARATGSNHPAILSLLPPAADDKAPALIHDEAKEFWILQLSAGTAGGKTTPLKLVVVGVSEG